MQSSKSCWTRLCALALPLIAPGLLAGCLMNGQSPDLVLKGTVAESREVVSLSPTFLARQQEAESRYLNSETVTTEEGTIPLAFDPNFPQDDSENSESSEAEMASVDEFEPALDMSSEEFSANLNAVGDFMGIPLIWPLEKGRLSSPFGMRKRRMHAGIDISAPRHTPIRAAASGQVLIARKQNGYGKVIIIEHGQDRQTLYSHLDTFKVGEGDVIRMGDVIGTVGRTGRATGFHLHFETRIGRGIARDPLAFLPRVKGTRPKLSFEWDSSQSNPAM